MLTFADSVLSSEHALAHLRAYADAAPATIRFYDYGGALGRVPTPRTG